jgi:hypothetical protein
MSEQTTAGGTIVGAQAAPSAGDVPGEVLQRDQPCVKCGYMLRGLPVGGVCPECGTGVADSLKGILLQFAGEPYRKTVQSGLALVLNGILVAVLLQLMNGGLRASGGGNEVIALLMSGASLLVSCVIAIGYWRFTQPDPGYTGLEKPNSARAVARWAAVTSAASQLVLVVVSLSALLLGAGAGGLAVLAFVLLAVVLVYLLSNIVLFFAAMRYTHWMAMRVPDVTLAKRAKRYLWLLPLIAVLGLLIIIGPLIALVMYWNLLDRLRKHVKAINTTGAPAKLPGMLG